MNGVTENKDMSDTPETDAHLAEQVHTYSPSVNPNLARKLERERNEANCLYKSAVAAMTAFQSERDQLRKVADELAKATDDFLSIRNESHGVTGWHLNGDVLPWEQCEPVGDIESALLNYNSLPHVIKRNKAK